MRWFGFEQKFSVLQQTTCSKQNHPEQLILGWLVGRDVKREQSQVAALVLQLAHKPCFYNWGSMLLPASTTQCSGLLVGLLQISFRTIQPQS